MPFGADAMVHVGRHGTLEWLPGKQVGQAGDDSAEVLLGDLPNAYVYIQDGGGEAIQAKRRSAAVLVSHLSPLLASAGQPPVLAQLDEAIEQAEATRGSSPELSAQYRQQAIAQMRTLKLDQQLGLDADAPWAQIEPILHAFLHKVEAEPMPLGIHALGEMPPEADQADACAAAVVPTAPIPPMTPGCTAGPRIWSPAERRRWTDWPTIASAGGPRSNSPGNGWPICAHRPGANWMASSPCCRAAICRPGPR